MIKTFNLKISSEFQSTAPVLDYSTYGVNCSRVSLISPPLLTPRRGSTTISQHGVSIRAYRASQENIAPATGRRRSRSAMPVKRVDMATRWVRPVAKNQAASGVLPESTALALGRILRIRVYHAPKESIRTTSAASFADYVPKASTEMRLSNPWTHANRAALVNTIQRRVQVKQRSARSVQLGPTV